MFSPTLSYIIYLPYTGKRVSGRNQVLSLLMNETVVSYLLSSTESAAA
jgi:hypothetical protein